MILAGGSGNRLWPLSRGSLPKQFLQFGGDKTLLQRTVLRFLGTYPVHDFLILTSQEFYHQVKGQIESIDPRLAGQIVLEPEKKNTAPAIALAVKHMQEHMGSALSECFLVTPSDQLISPEQALLNILPMGEERAKEGSIVLYGIRPNKPETGYGYFKIKEISDNFFPVERFVEKPDKLRAQQYLLSGDYLWNTGIFISSIETFLQEMELYCPEIGSCRSYRELFDNFGSLPEISIDYALLEHSPSMAAMPLNAAWSDVGSWDSVYEVMDKDHNQNVKVGNILDIDTKNCLIMGGKRLISTIGLEDLFIIETEDAIFLGKKGESQRVRALVEELKKRKL